jgi:Plasmid maintenance system antidote protein
VIATVAKFKSTRKPVNKKLRGYIRQLVDKYGTQTALSEKIGMTLSAFSRAVNEEGTFSFENCLRLADAFGDDPVVVLRVAGKLNQADLFQRVRGEKVASLRAQIFLEKWSKINTENQNQLDSIASAMVIAETYKSEVPNHTPRGGSSLSSGSRKRKPSTIRGLLTA